MEINIINILPKEHNMGDRLQNLKWSLIGYITDSQNAKLCFSIRIPYAICLGIASTVPAKASLQMQILQIYLMNISHYMAFLFSM